MRIAGGSGQRANYYDRNPLNATIAYNSGLVAPHGGTVRASYTIPANRKAFSDSQSLLVARDGTATTAGYSKVWMRYTPNGGGTAPALQAQHNNTVIGTQDIRNQGASGAYFAGDLVEMLTSDASTAGTNSYQASFKLTEFDA